MMGEAPMDRGIVLHGYRYSVYTRAVRIALECKGLDYETVEVDPFDAPDPAYLALHPFGRVPVLVHGAFRIFETRAIGSYIDRAFDGPPLHPAAAEAHARMEQVMSIVDSYGYWPMVRQVFAQRVFQPLEGGAPDEAQIAEGLAAARPVLSALDAIAGEGHVLGGRDITLADCHLAPMIDYFLRAVEGRAALKGHPNLCRWWDKLSALPQIRATDPGLPAMPG
ncbi:glutathione S-transferase family protein [Roseovarius aquimarinus]|uniref:glutathione transferase n=1 Tax=Roseovarius aquimarinus TaxID=1229156 RepID=A0ABW7I3P1_9RHOB